MADTCVDFAKSQERAPGWMGQWKEASPYPTRRPEPTAQSLAAGGKRSRDATDGQSDLTGLARRYDIRAVTPYEIDEIAAQLPADGKDAMARLCLLTYGAEFRRNLAVVAWQAGLTARPDETLETHLNTRLDLIEAVEEAKRRPQFSGRRREGSKEFADWLHVFVALPAAKVT